MPVTKIYDINASGGAGTDIPFPMTTRYLEMVEDGGGTSGPQGLTYQRADDAAGAFTSTFTAAASEVIKLGHRTIEGSGIAPVIGYGAQETAPAAYSAGTTYKTGETVTSSSVVYYSLVDSNTGNTPASSPTKWQSFTQWNLKAAPFAFKTVKSKTATATKVRVTFHE